MEEYHVDFSRAPRNETLVFKAEKYIGIKRIEYNLYPGSVYIAHCWIGTLYGSETQRRMPIRALIEIGFDGWDANRLGYTPDGIVGQTVCLSATGSNIHSIKSVSDSEVDCREENEHDR